MDMKQVKEELPDVKVRTKRGVVGATVRGRKNKFATVCTKDDNACYEFSWEAITRAVNSDKPLRL